jgi:hypothetical protein
VSQNFVLRRRNKNRKRENGKERREKERRGKENETRIKEEAKKEKTLRPAAKLVQSETPKSSMPMAWAEQTSGTVDMPKAPPPDFKPAWTSEGVS